MSSGSSTLTESPVTGSLYTEHVAALQDAYADALEESQFDAVAIHSGMAARQSRFDDQYWPYRPTPAFAHWLPLGRADATLLVQPGKRPTLIVVTADDFWESEPEPESDHFWSAFDELEVTEPGAVSAALPSGRVAFIGDAEARAAGWGLADEVRNPPALLAALDRVRARKTDYERACMAEANRRAALGHIAIQEAFHRGDRSELELHLEYLRATEQDDSQTPYKNIVAIDENAAILHHVNYGCYRPRHRGQSLLVDAGATCLGYAADVTRTVVKGTDDSAAAVFGELIARMETLQAEVCRRVRPGLEFEALHDQAHELLAAVLSDLAVSSASPDELVASGATRCFLPHGLGHSIGVQVHDVGCRPREPHEDNPFLRNTTVITAGQVFTIEPGCYFIDSLMHELRTRPVGATVDWDLVDALSHFGGIRIEDDLAVLDDGTVNLTRDNWPTTP